MPTHPLILAHGICRFDAPLHRFFNDEEPDALNYFRYIKTTLSDRYHVFHSSVPWAASVEERADALKIEVEKVLQRTAQPKVHIIAHSMGGLDARHMMFKYRKQELHLKIASLTTIGTPHLGTSFADHGLARTGGVALAFLNHFGVNYLDGFRDLTMERCRQFNAVAEEFEDSSGVHYSTYAGVQQEQHVFWPLRDSWRIIHEREGANDGLVSEQSAQWKAKYSHPAIAADHLNELGWWEPADARPQLRLLPPTIVSGETPTMLERRIRELYRSIALELETVFPTNQKPATKPSPRNLTKG